MPSPLLKTQGLQIATNLGQFDQPPLILATPPATYVTPSQRIQELEELKAQIKQSTIIIMTLEYRAFLLTEKTHSVSSQPGKQF